MAEQSSVPAPAAPMPSLADALPAEVLDGEGLDGVDGDLTPLHRLGEVGGTYDASAITVLEGLEAVRKRPGMYIGSTGERGLHHLVYEVVDNSVDEALAGYATPIEVTLLADGGVRVVDDGRGIPVDIVASEGRPAVEVVLTVLHAGGKFGGGGYSVSGGLHGVGVSWSTPCPSRLEVEVHRQGHVWRQSYRLGVPTAPLEQGEPSDETGTTVTFWPSPSVFETTVFDFETLRSRFQQMAFLNKGLQITLDRRAGRPRGRGRHGARASSFRVRRRPGRLRQEPQQLEEGRAGAPRHHRLRGRGHRAPACRSRSRCSGRRRTARASTPTRTPSTRTRAGPTRRGSARR